jgi:hypothetical protein
MIMDLPIPGAPQIIKGTRERIETRTASANSRGVTWFMFVSVIVLSPII